MDDCQVGDRGRVIRRLRDRVRFAGREVRCPVCEGRFGRFRLTEGGPLELECPRCGSRPRQRLLWLYLSAERLLASRGLRILHLAPERCIERRLRSLEGADYVTVGIENPLADVRADCTALPFEDGSFDTAVSFWTHTDIDDLLAAMREVARVLRPEAPFVYVGCHPCFVGPHSVFVAAEGVPEFHPGYRPSRRYDASAPGVANPDGVRARVGGVHLTLHDFFGAFTEAGFRIERIEELGDRDYPHVVALRARR